MLPGQTWMSATSRMWDRSKRHGDRDLERMKAMRAGNGAEEDIPSNTKLSCILLDLVKSRIFSMFQYSLLISIASVYRYEY